jgi:hypothetical protein
MNIGVDCGVLGLDNKVQGGNYQLSLSLIVTLAQIDRKNLYRLYSITPIPKEIKDKLPANFLNIVVWPNKWWMQFGLSLELIKNPVDVFLGLNQSLPFYCPCKSVVFVLDPAFKDFSFLFDNVTKISFMTKKTIQCADRIIAISRSTKRDITRVYKRRDNIDVVYLG